MLLYPKRAATPSQFKLPERGATEAGMPFSTPGGQSSWKVKVVFATTSKGDNLLGHNRSEYIKERINIDGLVYKSLLDLER